MQKWNKLPAYATSESAFYLKWKMTWFRYRFIMVRYFGTKYI